MKKSVIIISIAFLGIFSLGLCFNSVNAQEVQTIPKVKRVSILERYPKKIRLQWKKVHIADYYQIKVVRKTNSGKFKLVKRIRTRKNVRRKYVRKLKPSKTYYFRVRALKNKKPGLYSKRIRGKTKQAATPIVEDPVFELPLANIDEVTGIQVFHDSASSQEHTGYDFKLPNPTEIIAPIGGQVTDIHKMQMSNNLWIIDVFIKYNESFSTFIAFEPWTYEESVIDDQMTYITVSEGDTVTQGQSLGTLQSVPASDFPHIHWQVQQNDIPVNPYNHVSDTAKAQMDSLCTAYSRPCDNE